MNEMNEMISFWIQWRWGKRLADKDVSLYIYIYMCVCVCLCRMYVVLHYLYMISEYYYMCIGMT